jgi:hypothetical protein
VEEDDRREGGESIAAINIANKRQKLGFGSNAGEFRPLTWGSDVRIIQSVRFLLAELMQQNKRARMRAHPDNSFNDPSGHARDKACGLAPRGLLLPKEIKILNAIWRLGSSPLGFPSWLA